MRVNLTYFKRSGEYFACGVYHTDAVNLWRVWEQVRDMVNAARLPGLEPGHDEYIVQVDVPEHTHHQPHLVIRR